MKTILWNQGESTNSKDLYYLDGIFIDDENLKRKLSRELSSCRNFGMFHKNNIKKAKKEGRIKENSYVAFTDNGIFISSNYKTTDIVGRQIIFEFYCETLDFETAIEQLIAISQKNGKVCDENELRELKKIILEPEITNQTTSNSDYSSSGKEFDKKKATKTLFFIILVLSILAIVSEICSKEDQEINDSQKSDVENVK
ncbi:MAG: hypothetical protein KBT22_04540 [Bacteroidales bacterium]|nr:hypothetical protein [Candidatus Scybalocola fimicaballi]